MTGALSASLALVPALASAQSNSQAPAPGQQGDWGQAGPPPDAQNGQIPSQADGAQDQNADQAPAQYPGAAPQDQPQAQPQGQPQANPGVGYGQGARPAYQPNQGAPANGYPQTNNGYQATPPPAAPPSGPVTLASGLLLPVRTSEPLDSKRVKPGDYFQGTVAQSIYVGNVLAIPRGAQVTGRVADVKKAGDLKGGASIALQLTSLSLGGASYSLLTDTFDTSSPGKGGYTAANTVGGTALGAAIGAIAGGGPGAAIGAVAGAGVGLGASAATPGPRSVVPAEALLTFHLTSPATVQPVSMQEAQQIQASVAPPQGRGAYGPRPGYGYPAGYPAGYVAPAPGYPPPPPPPPGYAPYPYPYVYAYPYPYRYGYPYRYYRGW
jgi:hypothetical protein